MLRIKVVFEAYEMPGTEEVVPKSQVYIETTPEEMQRTTADQYAMHARDYVTLCEGYIAQGWMDRPPAVQADLLPPLNYSGVKPETPIDIQKEWIEAFNRCLVARKWVDELCQAASIVIGR